MYTHACKHISACTHTHTHTHTHTETRCAGLCVFGLKNILDYEKLPSGRESQSFKS